MPIGKSLKTHLWRGNQSPKVHVTGGILKLVTDWAEGPVGPVYVRAIDYWAWLQVAYNLRAGVDLPNVSVYSPRAGQ